MILLFAAKVSEPEPLASFSVLFVDLSPFLSFSLSLPIHLLLVGSGLYVVDSFAAGGDLHRGAPPLLFCRGAQLSGVSRSGYTD